MHRSLSNLSATALLAPALLVLAAARAANPPDASVQFNGQPDRVLRVDLRRPLFAPFTVEFWARPEQAGGSDMGFVGSGGGSFGLSLAVVGGTRLTTSLGDNRGWQVIEAGGTIPNPVGKWTHFAEVVTTNSWELFADGVSVAAGTLDGPPVWLAPPGPGLNLGVGGLPDVFLTGRMDEVRVWNVARSAPEIAGNRFRILAGDSPGLVGMWRFSEGSGSARGVESENVFEPFINVPFGGWAMPGAPAGGPSVATGPAPAVFPGDLTGKVETPVTARAWIEYGRPGSVTNRTAVSELVPTTTQSFDIAFDPPLPRGTWSFRAVAANESGTNAGFEQTFTSQFESDSITGGPGAGFPLSADINGDGFTDVVLNTGTGVTVTFGGADGFSSSPQTVTGLFPALGDLDGDGVTDIIMGTLGGGGSPLGLSLSLIRGTSSNTLESVPLSIPGLVGTMAIADLNGDGRPDLAINGATSQISTGGLTTIPAIKIYLNRGGLVFREMDHNLPTPGVATNGISDSRTKVVAADFDGDGVADLVINGTMGSPGTNYCGLWRNAGNGRFVEVNPDLIGPERIEGITAVDFDGDGKSDLLLNILRDNLQRELRLLHNVGDGMFAYTQNWYANTVIGGTFGDFDNNGRPEMYLFGDVFAPPVRAALWRFQENRLLPLKSSLDSITNLLGAVWLDADHDGDADLYVTPISGGARAYLNLLAAANSPPTAPGPVNAAISADRVRLVWAASADTDSPPPWVTYNVRIGTAAGAGDVLNSPAGAAGNAGAHTSLDFIPTPGTTYYVSVQAVDSQNLAGPRSPEVPLRFDLTRAGSGSTVPGDTNGDRLISLEELNAVIQVYRTARPTRP